MGYYDKDNDYGQRGIDDDLAQCIYYADSSDIDFGLDDIERVLAVHEGEPDGDCWRWVLLMKNGDFTLLVSSSAYSGWDCGGSWESYVSLDALSVCNFEDDERVRLELRQQVLGVKDETWRERMDNEFFGDSK